MGVSLNDHTTKSSILTAVVHYKPSILGYPYFWKDTYGFCKHGHHSRLLTTVVTTSALPAHDRRMQGPSSWQRHGEVVI